MATLVIIVSTYSVASYDLTVIADLLFLFCMINYIRKSVLERLITIILK
jgi:hypothetical protein